MQERTRNSLLAILASLAAAGAVAWAGSRGGAAAGGGLPLLLVCAAAAFALNWLAFVPAWLLSSERFYDLTGAITHLVLLACALALGPAPDPRALLLAALAALWAVRLGSFLFLRIRREGGDRRFDAIKPDFARFLTTWTLQALWVFLTLSCALAAITSLERVALGGLAGVGAAVWALGFVVEVVADWQKSVFRSDPAHRGRFIDTGLWAWSRHPNYFGEITLWVGIAIIALPALSGWQYVTLISPIFVWLLLTRVSGIPMLESRARRQWGEDPAYQAYASRTPLLVPRPPGRG